MILTPGGRPVPNEPTYQLLHKLGAGAFGQVWKARGPGGIEMALKFIPLDSPERAATELRSVEVMKSVRHPNLVSLSGAWHKDNWLVLAMELCDCTLRDRLADYLSRNIPGIPLDELLNYMSDAANGLDALTAKRVQHRDVKPANLLLLGSGVKVGDFGLAKVLEHTASNTGSGTLGYMAPECYTGKLVEQSDQYSLAATYYHLRTGRMLYTGNQAEIMYAQLASEPDLSLLPPSEATVLARALARDPGKRWPSCTAFVNGFVEARRQDHEEKRNRQESDRPRSVPVAPWPNREQAKRNTIDPWLDNWSRATGCGAAVIVFLVAGYLLLDDHGQVYNTVLKQYERSLTVNGWHFALIFICAGLAAVFIRGIAWIRKELAQRK
jgi:serine/threonine protein kinase